MRRLRATWGLALPADSNWHPVLFPGDYAGLAFSRVSIYLAGTLRKLGYLPCIPTRGTGFVVVALIIMGVL